MDNTLDLPEASDEMVWCERCQRIHKRITFSRQDYERVITQAARNLADTIDHQAMNDIYAKLKP